jgi:ABC-type glycerol-3-phosphate transport system substrate-binding protein
MLLDIYGHIMWDFFLRGKGLFTMTNAWVINAFIKEHKKKDEFMAMVIPGNVRKAPYMGGSCLGVVSGTKKIKESISLVKFLTSFQSQKRYLTATGQLPARKDVMNHIIDNYVYKDAILKSVKTAKTYPAVPYWGSFENILLEFINLILSMISNNIYNEKHLRDEVQLVNNKIDTVIQLWER